MKRLARGTAPPRFVTRSHLVLALKAAEERGSRQLAAELRRMLGGLSEVNNPVRTRDGLDREG